MYSALRPSGSWCCGRATKLSGRRCPTSWEPGLYHSTIYRGTQSTGCGCTRPWSELLVRRAQQTRRVEWDALGWACPSWRGVLTRCGRTPPWMGGGGRVPGPGRKGACRAVGLWRGPGGPRIFGGGSLARGAQGQKHGARGGSPRGSIGTEAATGDAQQNQGKSEGEPPALSHQAFLLIACGRYPEGGLSEGRRSESYLALPWAALQDSNVLYRA